MPRYASSAASAAIAAALAAIAFAGKGGSEIQHTTIVELGIVLVGGLLIALALSRRAPEEVARTGGGLTLAAFGLLAAVTAVSITWSIVPELSWLEASRTLAYLVAFAAAVIAARLFPDAPAVLLRGILLAVGAIVVYALVSRVWPAQLATNEIYARLGQPYGYWNALGSTGALAVPALLWLGARRTGRPFASALAYPLLSLVVVAIFLSYSRAGMIVAGIGALAWLAIVPLRLRSLTLLAVSLAGAAPVVVWALQKDAFTRNQVPLAVRESVSTQFGLFLLATVLVVLAAGLAIGFVTAERPPSTTLRLRIGVVATAIACAVPVVLVLVLAASDRGLTGTIKADYESFVSVKATTPGGPERLLTASSSRGRYWHQAKLVFDHNRLTGTGAGTYGVARLRYRQDDLVSRHAHGYVHQTLSDFGLIGAGVCTLLLIAWLVAAARAVALGRRRREFPPERIALVALALSAVVFGLHSAVDWVWFVPGPAVMALVAAGFVVGRGPFDRPRTTMPPLDAPRPQPAVAAAIGSGTGTAPASGGAVAVAEPPAVGPDSADTVAIPPLRRRVLRRLRPPEWAGRPALVLLTVAATLASAWAVWQPLRADDASNHAVALAASGRYVAALGEANAARGYDPLSAKPLIVRAAVEDRQGDRHAARHDLERAVIEFRGDPQVWLALADYELNTLNDPADAERTATAALYLDPRSREAQNTFFAARDALTQPANTPPPGAGGVKVPPPVGSG